MNNSDYSLSIILLSYQSGSRIIDVWEQYKTRLESENIPFEFIIMDDGSTDDSYEIALSLERKDNRVKAYGLLKNVTSPYSQFAGFKLSTGSCAIAIPDDNQRPIDAVIKAFRAWQKGHKMVIIGRSRRNDGWLSDFFSSLYYKVMDNLSVIHFPKGGADAFLADRSIIDILNNQVSPINTTPLIEVLKMGFSPHLIYVERPAVRFKSRWTFSKKVNLAKDTFFASSSFPLKMITWVGFFIFTFSIILIIGLIFGKLFSDNTLFGFPIQGWTSTIILVSFFNGLTLFCIGIVSEYIYRIFEEVKGRPSYIIKDKKSERVE